MHNSSRPSQEVIIQACKASLVLLSTVRGAVQSEKELCKWPDMQGPKDLSLLPQFAACGLVWTPRVCFRYKVGVGSTVPMSW